MASFLPSFFQKRLLKYALSRLEFVDTEALDLDSLGIRWGQRSTVELRDIGLRLEKLAALLHLPTSSKLLSARIRSLKLTVPADIYSSGIICEADGIDVRLKLPSEKDVHAAKGNIFSGRHETIIPNPADLAESFLQTEPKEEKEELQAAISSRSQVLHRSSVSISDDEDELGLGNEAVSLPSFIAAFLNGVVDRLQVRVENISIRLDVETKQEGSSKRQPEDKPDLISGVLSIRQVSVGAVATASASGEHPLHIGKRPVSLANVNFALVSEPAVFSNYSRFTAPASPSTPLPSKASQPSSPGSFVPPAPSSASSSTHAMMESTVFGLSHHSISPIPEEHNIYRLEGSAYTYDGRFSDADTEEARSHGYMEDSQTLSEDERLLDNPAYLDSVIDSSLQDDDLDDLDDPPPTYFAQPDTDESTPRLQNSVSQASELQVKPRRSSLASIVAASEPSIRDAHRLRLEDETLATQSSAPNVLPAGAGNSNNPVQTSGQIPVSPYETDGSDTASNYFNDDLSESRLFSNEEAQSMYMSAMSHDSNSRSFIPNIPGAWDSPEATLSGHAAHPDTPNRLVQSTTLDQEDQDRTPISTPKPTGNEGKYPLGRGFFDDLPDTNSDSSDKHSVESPSRENDTTEAAKRLLTIDRVTIWIPSAKHEKQNNDISESTHTVGDNFKDSTAHLAASQASERLVSSLKTPSSLRGRRDSTDPAVAVGGADTKSDSKHGSVPPSSENDISIEISAIDIQFDIALGWLVAKFGQRAQRAFGGNQASGNEGTSRVDAQDLQSFGLTLSRLTVKFVEHIPEAPCTPGQEQAAFTPTSSFLHDEIIIQATASGCKMHFSSVKDTTKLSAELSKFTFGFASEDLISFSEDVKMRESTRDISPASGDISFSLSRSRDSAIFTIATLPLCVNLNTQRLEEALGWFGGLSTIMELGGSISSIAGTKSPKQGVPKRARGVHFEGPSTSSPKAEAGSTPWKVNARIGGIALDIAGESHYLTLRTTAAKIVSRYEGMAVSIDKAKLSGPFSLDDSRDAPASISLNGVRVDFLYTPKEPDLDRLLSLITPSKDKYDQDDDIMLDTLFRQRKQGSVLRVTVAGAKVIISRIPDLRPLQQLGEELGRLSNVTKYLPEDDRPGILTLALIEELEAQVHVGGKVGTIMAKIKNTETAHISIPSLVASQVESIRVVRNGDEELIGSALPLTSEAVSMPTLMVRFIADEMDPTIKIKIHNLRVEYTIPSVTAFLGISDEMTSGHVASNMASSLANLAELQPPSQEHQKEENSANSAKPTKLTVAIRDCVLGLNPRGTVARGLVVLTHASFGGTIQDLSSEANLDLRKASIMVIDDASNVGSGTNIPRRSAPTPQSSQVRTLMNMGYVSVSSISSATATVKIMRLADNGTNSLDVEIRDDLLILETCADSTQTLISIMNGLQPPTPPSEATKYRTEVIPINDMLASFSGDAFTAIEPEDRPAETAGKADILEHDELEYVSDFHPEGPLSGSNELADSFQSQFVVSSSVSELEFRDDHFTQQSSVGGTAHRWDSAHNTYGLSNDSKLRNSPLRVRIRDVHVIWNLFDGYDWPRTRDTISKAVKDVEKKVTERRTRAGSRASPNFDDEEDVVIGDCLFNSIYINIPATRDPSDLRGDISQDINRNIDDLTSETGSYATTSTVTTVRRNNSPNLRGKKLRLSRSKAHKMTFEIKGICADLVVFPPGSGETLSSLDVRVKELEIFDHLPSSTWKKFATYMREAGEKETGTSMVHLEILTVRPVTDLAAFELVLKVTVLPLRLHVDQDALDFLSRFFEFRDESAPAPGPPQDPPYLQRVEVNAIPVKLDFKPKHVDYASLRSGRTTELMNFLILDEADMVMRHIIIYGISGFDRLGQMLNDIWMPDVTNNQLPGVLAGLAPFRSLVNVGSGVKDLVVVPLREYRKDGRIVRSIQKGALAFAKTTSNELVKLGAKLAIGTQTVLQSAEELLTTPTGQPARLDDEYEIDDDEVAKKISLYADQPVGVVQGLRGAFRGLERDILLTRDAIIAVPGEVAESGSAKAAAHAVLKRAPTVILRPAIGVSKAVGQTLLGAGNSLDPSNRRKIEDKYKRH